MSGLILPEHVRKVQEAHAARAATAVVEKEESDDAVQAKLPTPCGYKMLVSLAVVEEKYESGILKADAVIRQDEVASVIAFIIKQGPDCYKDQAKFPNGAYCKEGDFVLLRTYSGTRFKIRGVEFRLINDDAVEAVVLDPRGYSRA